MSKKKRIRNKTGWAFTKKYPHENHPANYRKYDDDTVDYITYTHSAVVHYKNGDVKTIPMNDNVSEIERFENKRLGNKNGENISYAYPKVFVGKRSALGKEVKNFSYVDEDKTKSNDLFNSLPRENVPLTGGSSKYRNRNKKHRN